MAMTNEPGRVYDELLVTLVRTGDRVAAERLAARWYPRLLRTARRLLRDEDQALEAVQEAWAGICRGWVGLSDTRKFPPWAFAILRRKCADRIRLEQAGRNSHTDLNGQESDDVAPDSETRISIGQALESLSHDHRLAAILYFHEGLTLPEVATATGVPTGTAKSRIFHARRQLKAVLQGDQK